MNAFFTLPIEADDLDSLSKMVRSAGTIVSVWPEFAACEWQAFAQEAIVHSSVIYAHLDTNILSYLVDLYDGREPNELRRLSAAMMAIAVGFDFKVNPTVAIHEYARTGRDEPDERLAAFYAIDSTHPQLLADYALGRVASICFPRRSSLEPTPHRGNLSTVIRGHAFYSTLVSKVASFHLDPRFGGFAISARVERFNELIDWMFYELGYSAAVVEAAAQLWGDRCRRPALKLAPVAPAERFFRRMENSIWDIVALESWAEFERERSAGDPMHLLFTADAALAELGPPLFARHGESPEDYSRRTLELYWNSDIAASLAGRYLDYQQRLDEPTRRMLKDLGSVRAGLHDKIRSFLPRQ